MWPAQWRVLGVCVALFALLGGALATPSTAAEASGSHLKPPAATSTAPRRITDALGREVRLPGEVTRLAAIGPGALRLIVYLGRGTDSVGFERIERRGQVSRPYALALAERLDSASADAFAERPTVGAGGPGRLPNLEQLIRLAPDVIVASFLDPGQLRQIQAKTGRPVVAVSYGASYGGRADTPARLDAITASLRLLGRVLDRPNRAEAILETIARYRDRLAERLPADQKVPVYVGGLAYKGAQGLTSTEAGYIPFTLLGLANPVVAGAAPGHRDVQLEALTQARPDWLFLDALSRPLIETELRRHRRVLDLLPAVRAGRVRWLVPNNSYNTNIANLLVNAVHIAGTLAPDRTPDAHTEARRIYRAFFDEPAATVIMQRHYRHYLESER